MYYAAYKRKSKASSPLKVSVRVLGVVSACFVAVFLTSASYQKAKEERFLKTFSAFFECQNKTQENKRVKLSYIPILSMKDSKGGTDISGFTSMSYRLARASDLQVRTRQVTSSLCP